MNNNGEYISKKEFDFADYRWKNRLVIVYSDSQDNPTYKTFIKNWKSSIDSVRERDLLLLEIIYDRGYFQDQLVNDKSLHIILNRFTEISDSFKCILIGKDGTVKLETSQVSVSDIFSLIDSMPMRKQEINYKNTQ
jgi:hypothetical protein